MTKAVGLTQTSPYFDFLPKEPVLTLFSYVSSVSFTKLSQVCKRFNQLIWHPAKSSEIIPGNNFKRVLAMRHLLFLANVTATLGQETAKKLLSERIEKMPKKNKMHPESNYFEQISINSPDWMKPYHDAVEQLMNADISSAELFALSMTKENSLFMNGVNKSATVLMQMGISLQELISKFYKENFQKILDLINSAKENDTKVATSTSIETTPKPTLNLNVSEGTPREQLAKRYMQGMATISLEGIEKKFLISLIENAKAFKDTPKRLLFLKLLEMTPLEISPFHSKECIEIFEQAAKGLVDSSITDEELTEMVKIQECPEFISANKKLEPILTIINQAQADMAKKI